MPSGSQNGISNNPKGKPKGLVSPITKELRALLANKIDVEELFRRIKKLEDKDYVDAMIKVIDRVLPKLGEEIPDQGGNVVSILQKFKDAMDGKAA